MLVRAPGLEPGTP